MSLVWGLGRRALFQLDAETAHNLSIEGLKTGLLPACRSAKNPKICQTLHGLTFENPIGLAAGYDKNGEVPDAILRLGFGFSEVGTVTPRPQAGNPKPRIFRVPSHEGVINRLGFNNQGHARVEARLKKRMHREGIVGINIGANKDSEDFVADYEAGIERFYPHASYFTMNISSPNTPGLRNLQAGEALKTLLERTLERAEQQSASLGKSVPIFLKLAPDVSEEEMDEIAPIINGSALNGVIISNTTIRRDLIEGARNANEAGGLSGKPLFAFATKRLAQMKQRLREDLTLIGVGGVTSTQTAMDKLEAGADLVQVYSGLIYEGPKLAHRIANELPAYLDRVNAAHLGDIIGTKTDEWAKRDA